MLICHQGDAISASTSLAIMVRDQLDNKGSLFRPHKEPRGTRIKGGHQDELITETWLGVLTAGQGPKMVHQIK